MISEKEQKAREVDAVTLIGIRSKTSNSYGRNLPYMRYRVFLNKTDGEGMHYQREISDVFTEEELKDLSYWSKRSLSMSMTCWGTSQLFEAQLALADFLGWGQQKSEEWSDYTYRATHQIKEL